jgi:hypothetical protein
MENSSTGVFSFAQAAFSERIPKKLPGSAHHIIKPVESAEVVTPSSKLSTNI